MKTVNIQEAKALLAWLIDEAAKGEPFVIAKAGKPVVKVEALKPAQPRRIGFMKGAFTVPDDIDMMFRAEIEQMFYGLDNSVSSQVQKV